jgi:hypothetical protein
MRLLHLTAAENIPAIARHPTPSREPPDEKPQDRAIRARLELISVAPGFGEDFEWLGVTFNDRLAPPNEEEDSK